MELKDTRDISAPPEAVWTALLDADVLRRCVPGCTDMDGNPDDGFTATVVQKVGPVKATFKGEVTLNDMKPPHSLTITGQGKGGPAGFASGGADVVLTPDGTGTKLSYDVNAKVGGKMAQLGSRIIDGFARKMADQFFDDFKKAVEGGDAENANHDDTSVAEKNKDTIAEKKGWVKRLIGSKN
ncbi:CoxG family protein [Loktanella sp. M215]|uniref:CoxG family protein n=1 Tax=Loktanella sp. M215 TaxID=2675431 RepID=UPI001F2908CD|nr:carbon monoxide dehydrogenase subunit G [Loktanella sp. M215]MBU2358052.1 carbon monoxide dehydrogenase subunit G [Alphaproteobacteria bacterium]MCF7701846.1 carbon monoxide dehydrogenase [Loktanella sp. M215]